MTHLILVNGTELPAFDWVESPDENGGTRHARDQSLLERGVRTLGPGEVSFRCDQPLPFDTTFEQKGDGRKFVVIAGDRGLHVAKPY